MGMINSGETMWAEHLVVDNKSKNDNIDDSEFNYNQSKKSKIKKIKNISQLTNMVYSVLTDNNVEVKI